MCAHIAIHAISTFQQTFNKAETLPNSGRVKKYGLFGDDKPRTDDYGSTSASDYDHGMGDDYDPIEIDDYIEEEEDY